MGNQDGFFTKFPGHQQDPFHPITDYKPLKKVVNNSGKKSKMILIVIQYMYKIFYLCLFLQVNCSRLNKDLNLSLKNRLLIRMLTSKSTKERLNLPSLMLLTI